MPNDNNTTTSSVEEAIGALADLGVTGSVDIGTSSDPALIVGWCRWAQQRRHAGQEIRTGLIVSKIRSGEQPPRGSSTAGPDARKRKWEERRRRFRERALPFPPGSVAERHADAERRCRHGSIGEELFPEDYEDEAPVVDVIPVCDGSLVVVDRGGMVVTVRCDSCHETLAYPPRALETLPSAPLAIGREIPPAPGPVRPVPVDGPSGDPAGLRRLDPLAVLGVAVGDAA